MLVSKASTIAAFDVRIHSRSRVFYAPSGILFNQYHQIPRRSVPLTRNTLISAIRAGRGATGSSVLTVPPWSPCVETFAE